MTRYICFILLMTFLLSAKLVLGQITVHHTHDLVELQQNDAGSLIVTDGEGQMFELQNYQFIPVSVKAKSKSTSVYSLDQGKLRYHLDSSSFNIYVPPDSALAFLQLDAGILVSSFRGLYLFNEGKFRSYYQSAFQFPDSIISFSLENEMMAMLTENGHVSVYDLNKQTLTPLPVSGVTAIAWDKWNGLWFAAGKSLMGNKTFINELGPDLQLNHNGPYVMRKSENLVIPYRACYSQLRNNVSTYYRLKDTDKWKRCESSSKVVLQDLKPGRFTLQLKSTTADNKITFSTPIKVQVRENDWLNEFWPWLAGVFGLLFLVAGWGQIRLRRELARLSEEKDKISLQYELKNQKQLVGQLQMNPHFLFNTLNSISGLIALNENKKARKYLSEFSHMMRNVLDGSRSEYHSIAEEIKFLSQYLSLEKMCRNDSFEYELTAKLDAEKLQLPALIIQPFVENAILHGLKQKKSGGTLKINLEEENKYLKVTIEDNGIGRVAASAFRSEGHDSSAIEIITQRIETLDRWGQGGVTYEDLYDEEGLASGTRVVVRVGKVRS